MKSYRTSIAAVLLAIVFSTSAFAGDGVLHTGITPPPPPPAQADGVLHTGIAAPTTEEDVMTEIALSLLQTLAILL